MCGEPIQQNSKKNTKLSESPISLRSDWNADYQNFARPRGICGHVLGVRICVRAYCDDYIGNKDMRIVHTKVAHHPENVTIFLAFVWQTNMNAKIVMLYLQRCWCLQLNIEGHFMQQHNPCLIRVWCECMKLLSFYTVTCRRHQRTGIAKLFSLCMVELI